MSILSKLYMVANLYVQTLSSRLGDIWSSSHPFLSHLTTVLSLLFAQCIHLADHNACVMQLSLNLLPAWRRQIKEEFLLTTLLVYCS